MLLMLLLLFLLLLQLMLGSLLPLYVTKSILIFCIYVFYFPSPHSTRQQTKHLYVFLSTNLIDSQSFLTHSDILRYYHHYPHFSCSPLSQFSITSSPPHDYHLNSLDAILEVFVFVVVLATLLLLLLCIFFFLSSNIVPNESKG